MFKFIGESAVVIAICLSFFTFGFVLGANFFELTSKQVVAGLIAGAACGLTIFLVEYHRSKKQLSVARERLAA